MKADINQCVGLKIKHAREKHLKTTQQDFADRLGISRPSVVNIEKGRQQLSVPQLLAFAAVLGISPVELLPINDDIQMSKNISKKLPENTPKSLMTWLDATN